MRALEFQETGQPLALVERPEPTARVGEVVLQVAFCGICGSDVHATEASASQVPGGTVLGHEFSGTVVQSGDPAWREGDRAIAVPLWPCDDCRPRGQCTDGLGILCPKNRIVGLALDVPGGYAEYVRIGSPQLLKIPEGVDLDAAALAEPLAVGAHAVRLAGPMLGARTLIVGAGPIGLATALFAIRAGARDVVVSEPDATRRARALKLGATAVIDPAAADVATAFRDLTGSPPERIFECVGIPGILRQCIDLAGIRATIVVVGVCRHDDTLLPRVAIRKELRLQFVLGYTHQDFGLSLDLLQARGFEPEHYITARLGFDDLPAAFESLRTPNAHGKVLLDPTAAPLDTTQRR